MKDFIRNINQSEKIVYLYLFLVFCLNLVTFSTIELTFDESYYWIYSQFLDWGYFDHPPFVAIMIKMGTSIFGNNSLGVRILPNILFVLGSLFLWKMTRRQNPWVFIVLLSSFFLIQFSGMFALPDTGLFIFSILYFYFLKKYLERDSFTNSLLLGLTIAMLFYSKYHGLLMVLLSIFAIPQIVLKRSFWLVFVVALTCYLPHLWWQYQHDFISFKFHLFGRKEKHFDIANIFDYLGGQFVLAGFLIFLAILSKLKTINLQDSFERVLLYNTMGFYLVLLIVSVRNPIEANWSLSCVIALLILFCDRLDIKKIKYLMLPSLLILIVFRLTMYFPNFVKPKLNLEVNRLYEVTSWENDISVRIQKHCADSKIISDNYQHASKLSFYLREIVPALHLDSRESQFSILRLQDKINLEEQVCYITTENDFQGSLKIVTGLPDDIYVLNGLSYNELLRSIKK